MLVQDVMNRKFMSIHADSTVSQAISLLEREHADWLPVLRGQELLGIFSSKDVVAKRVKAGSRVGDLEVRHVVSMVREHCSPDDSVETAQMVMNKAHVQQLLVENETGRLVGIITERELNKQATERTRVASDN
jgi:predicted transcriptional regulator